MDIKDKVIAEYLTTGCGYRKLQQKYGIGRATICNWVQVYQGIHGLPKTTLQQKHYISPMKKKQKEANATHAALLEKIASLERQLEHEELRSVVLDKLIDVAEKTFAGCWVSLFRHIIRRLIIEQIDAAQASATEEVKLYVMLQPFLLQYNIAMGRDDFFSL